MDGCDARHNEEVLLSTIDRFVMAITAAEVVAWPVLVSSSTAQSLPCGCVGAKCNPRCDKRRLSVKAPFCDGQERKCFVSSGEGVSYPCIFWKHLR